MAQLEELRIGDAERDAVATALHDHFAAGRLSREELDERLDVTLAAKTRGDLRGIVRDLPEPNGLPEPAVPARAGFGGPPWARPGHPAWGHHHDHHAAWRQQRAMARHRHRGPFPVFPLLVAVFLFVAFTAGPGAAVLTVLQIALVVWVVKAVVMAVAARGRKSHT